MSMFKENMASQSETASLESISSRWNLFVNLQRCWKFGFPFFLSRLFKLQNLTESTSNWIYSICKSFLPHFHFDSKWNTDFAPWVVLVRNRGPGKMRGENFLARWWWGMTNSEKIFKNHVCWWYYGGLNPILNYLKIISMFGIVGILNVVTAKRCLGLPRGVNNH